MVNPRLPAGKAAPPTGSVAADAVADVVVDAPAGATVRDVHGLLLAAVGCASGDLVHGAVVLSTNTRIGHPPLVDGAILTVDLTEPRRRRPLLELHVAAGPDAGAVHYLSPGEHIIGRGAPADIRLNDIDVSRSHAVVHVSDDGLAVQDSRSTNGTTVGDKLVGNIGVPLAPGELLKVGASCLRVMLPEPASAVTRPDGEGHLAVNRPPRLSAMRPCPWVGLPTPPAPGQPTRFPLVAAALPALAGVALVTFTGNASYLFFVLLSPLMVVGTFVSDRISGRRGTREERRRYDEDLRTVRAHITGLVQEQGEARHRDHADAATLLLMAAGPRPSLWQRRPTDKDFLQVRVGVGNLPADIEVSGHAADRADLSAPEDDLLHPVLHDVPIALDLRNAGVTGMAGPRGALLSSARFTLAQLAGWHSPRHLRLVVLVGHAGARDDWRWTRWLPHLRPPAGQPCDLLVGLRPAQVAARVAELNVILQERLDQVADRFLDEPLEAILVVLDGAHALRRLAGVARLLAEGPAVAIYFLCLENDPAALPVECRSTSVVRSDDMSRLRVTMPGRSPEITTLDGVGEVWAERFARHLAPLRDATPDEAGATLPQSARLLDLVPYDARDPAAVGAAWGSAPRGTSLPLGIGADGATFRIDLVDDGPHLLVAGTTGSGKSELLQTVVAGLALANRPDELSFVLIDYKGGAAFSDCARLPHTVGMVTDLDGHLPERALTSLTAELRRRELVLRAASAKDLDDYRASPGADSTLVPRLVLVVDEFATLAEELPTFLSGLVSIAQRGRSLGVHLILATQRPGGVVSADIRANVGLRIALRVTDNAESADVIDSPQAALISRASPGRGLARLGAGAIVSFQCARVGGRAAPPAAAAQVRPMTWRQAGDPFPTAAVADGVGPTDLEQVVEAIRAAADHIAARPVSTPWLPPLDELLTTASLPEVPRWSVPFGLVDLPAEQRRAPLLLDLENGGHLLVAGTARTGRTTLLRTIAGSVASRFRADEVHLYALDGGSGGLSPLARLPHCGAVVPRDEPERADRLLYLLAAEVQRRQIVLARDGFSSAVEQRAAAAQEERMPWLVLLIDGWEAVQTAFDEVDHGRPLETLLRVVREGLAVGLRAVIAGDRGVITGRIGAAISDRLLMRMADPGDYALAGILTRQVPTAMPPGRALVAEGAAEAQVALLDEDPTGAAQIRALDSIAARASSAEEGGATSPYRRPITVRPLPGEVTRAAVAALPRPAADGQFWTPLGLGGDDASLQGVSLFHDAPAFLIIGPAGSGRSTGLLTMTLPLCEQGVEVIVICGARSPLRRLRDAPEVIACITADEADALALLVDQHLGPLAVVVDDAEMLHETAAESHLLRLLHAVRRGGRAHHAALLMSASGAAIAGHFRGLTVEARRGGCGLLLGEVGPMEADLLGVRPPARNDCHPGRALLVMRGRTTRVQIAHDPEHHDHDAAGA